MNSENSQGSNSTVELSLSDKDDTFSAINIKRLGKGFNVKKVFKKTTNKQYHDECKHGCFGRIFFNTVWLVVLAVMIFYTYQIASQYIIDSNNPSSTVTYLQQEKIPLPQVVVCNWNSDSSPLITNDSCPYCLLEMVSCFNVNTSSDCMSEWQYSLVNTTAGIFYCYTFNSDPNNITWSITTSYAGSYVTVFKVQFPNSTAPPGASSSARGGLQVTFGVQGTVTPDDIYREIHFAPIGTDTFYGISAINSIHGDLSTDDPNYNTTIYETISSGVTLPDSFQPNFENPITGYIGVSFAFQTLNLEVVTYGFTYTLENFFGDFAGMIGTLMGLDTIKVMAAIPVGWAAIKMRSCVPLEDLFNG